MAHQAWSLSIIFPLSAKDTCQNQRGWMLASEAMGRHKYPHFFSQFNRDLFPSQPPNLNYRRSSPWKPWKLLGRGTCSWSMGGERCKQNPWKGISGATVSQGSPREPQLWCICQRGSHVSLRSWPPPAADWDVFPNCQFNQTKTEQRRR